MSHVDKSHGNTTRKIVRVVVLPVVKDEKRMNQSGPNDGSGAICHNVLGKMDWPMHQREIAK